MTKVSYFEIWRGNKATASIASGFQLFKKPNYFQDKVKDTQHSLRRLRTLLNKKKIWEVKQERKTCGLQDKLSLQSIFTHSQTSQKSTSTSNCAGGRAPWANADLKRWAIWPAAVPYRCPISNCQLSLLVLVSHLRNEVTSLLNPSRLPKYQVCTILGHGWKYCVNVSMQVRFMPSLFSNAGWTRTTAGTRTPVNKPGKISLMSLR